jgi:peptidoglycan/xylan/chitin deacetylase (PgdA/CDA1 family)
MSANELLPITAGVLSAGLAAGGVAYAGLWPASQIFGRTLLAPMRPEEIALTFDDGPNGDYTLRLLDTLAAAEVHASFFMLGKFVRQQPELVRTLSAAGHLVGTHTENHPNLLRSRPSLVREEITAGKATLEEILGKRIEFFRPPYGARRPDALRICRELGMEPVLWNAMTSDWSAASAEAIMNGLMPKIARNQRRGFASCIVLHDGGHLALGTDRTHSITAAARLLRLYAPSHKFVTLKDWV